MHCSTSIIIIIDFTTTNATSKTLILDYTMAFIRCLGIHCVCMCVCVHVCVCVCVCVHVHVYMCVCVHADVYVCVCMQMYMCVYANVTILAHACSTDRIQSAQYSLSQ